MSESPVHIVFGATGGIGSELVRLLTADGARVAAVARNASKLAALHAETGARTYSADVTLASEVDRVFEAVLADHGRVDSAVNCVGSILLKPAHLTSVEDFSKTISLNLDSAFFIVRAASRSMMRTGGAIVLVSSAVASHGIHNHEAISAAKGGINALVRSAAATYARRGIRVNAVSPGLVRTPLTAHLTQNEASEKASLSMFALGSLGEPVDVAHAISFLVDPVRARWITGQVLGVDGGLSSVRPY